MVLILVSLVLPTLLENILVTRVQQAPTDQLIDLKPAGNC